MKTFKVLSHMGYYIDENLLGKGIYITSIPHLKSIDTTIEQMVERCKQMQDMAGNCFISEAYIENLKKCKLIDVNISNVYDK